MLLYYLLFLRRLCNTMGKMRDYYYQIILVFEKRQYNATRGCGIALPTLALLLCISMEGTTALYVLQRKVITLPSLPKSLAQSHFYFNLPPLYVPAPSQVFRSDNLRRLFPRILRHSSRHPHNPHDPLHRRQQRVPAHPRHPNQNPCVPRRRHTNDIISCASSYFLRWHRCRPDSFWSACSLIRTTLAKFGEGVPIHGLDGGEGGIVRIWQGRGRVGRRTYRTLSGPPSF